MEKARLWVAFELLGPFAAMRLKKNNNNHN